MSDHDASLTVRYSALFAPERDQAAFKELVLSLITLETFVAPFIDLGVVVYTYSGYQATYEKVARHFALPIRFHALNETDEFRADIDFVNSLQNCEDIDRICTLRMLNDFRSLPANANRLLVGCDVFFLGPPDEILSQCWAPASSEEILYMVDAHTFAGTLYRLKHFHGPHAEGLVGDFYFLPSSFTLTESAIKGCLRLIDTWPAGECRYVPETEYRSNQSEQQAASILLASPRSRPLPESRYGHIRKQERMAVLHTHNLDDVLSLLPPRIRELCHSRMRDIALEL